MMEISSSSEIMTWSNPTPSYQEHINQTLRHNGTTWVANSSN